MPSAKQLTIKMRPQCYDPSVIPFYVPSITDPTLVHIELQISWSNRKIAFNYFFSDYRLYPQFRPINRLVLVFNPLYRDLWEKYHVLWLDKLRQVWNIILEVHTHIKVNPSDCLRKIKRDIRGDRKKGCRRRENANGGGCHRYPNQSDLIIL